MDLNGSIKGNCMVDYAIQCNMKQYNTIQYNTIQYNTIQYNTIQYNSVQYNIMVSYTLIYDII